MTKEEDERMTEARNNNLCPHCLCSLPPVEVHGHVQCSVCHLVINECCQGETCSNS